jgi:hypothetical protein
MILKKLQLEYVPFEEYAHIKDKESLESLAKEHQLHQMESWLLPQIVAHYGKFKLYTAEGQVNVKDTLKLNIKDSEWEIGLWRAVSRLNRGSLVHAQSKPQGAPYSRLVPLIMAGFKQYQGVPYQLWPRDQIHLVVDELLAEAMCAEYDDFTPEELLEARELGLLIKSGNAQGLKKSVTGTWKLSGLQQLRVGNLPTLAQTMLCQCWVAHPSIRTPYMVLDPKQWDSMPEPLIDYEPMTTSKKETTKKVALVQKFDETDNRLPWEM